MLQKPKSFQFSAKPLLYYLLKPGEGNWGDEFKNQINNKKTICKECKCDFFKKNLSITSNIKEKLWREEEAYVTKCVCVRAHVHMQGRVCTLH